MLLYQHNLLTAMTEVKASSKRRNNYSLYPNFEQTIRDIRVLREEGLQYNEIDRVLTLPSNGRMGNNWGRTVEHATSYLMLHCAAAKRVS